jgi:predicted secreted acid phosphatase
VARREATAIPGARELMQRVQELGGLVVIVTNRKEQEQYDTEMNLRALDLPFDVVLAAGGDREKEPRWDAVAAGTAEGLPAAEILLWVGDNIQDFPHLDQALAEQPTSALAPFGDQFVLLPNPMYGSWKP